MQDNTKDAEMKEYNNLNKDKLKEYNNLNKDKLKEKRKEYYKSKKNQIK